MTGSLASRDISQAAHGVAAVVREAKDDQDAAALAYLAVYACGYAGRAGDLGRYRALTRCLRDEAFVAQLFRDVPDRVEVGGWTVTGRDGPRVLISRDGIQAFVFCHELGSPVEAGATVTFRAAALRAGSMPGFVLRRGTTAMPDRSRLSRLYLNIRPAAAAWALGPLARRLDEAAVPYEMKALANPRAYLRRDACVVYVPSDNEEQTIRIVTRAVEDSPVGPVSRSAPRLTGRVAPGVNLAHEPTDIEEGLSHGQWVARLFQDAALSTTDPVAIARRVKDLIAATGRDPSRPYLRAAGT